MTQNIDIHIIERFIIISSCSLLSVLSLGTYKTESLLIMKNCRSGKAECWTPNVIRKMRSRLFAPHQRLIFEISLFTGERMSAITQLMVSDVYDKSGKVLETLTFSRKSRKGTKHGMAATRQVAIHPDLKLFLSQYTPPKEGYLFPSSGKEGHITYSGVEKYWRSIFDHYGLIGFSTHSSRRWVINELRKSGIAVVTIAETMGVNIATVRLYLDNNPIECKKAIATLTV